MRLFGVLLTLFLCFGSRSWAESKGRASVKGFGVGKVNMIVVPTAVYFSPKDSTARSARDHSLGLGISLDLLSSLLVDAEYNQKIKNSKTSFTLAIPLTIEYGIKLGALYFDKMYQSAHAAQYTGMLHLDLFRLVSFGFGGYYAKYTGGIPDGVKSKTGGIFWEGHLQFFPHSFVRPSIGYRQFLNGQMQGDQVLFGITLGYLP